MPQYTISFNMDGEEIFSPKTLEQLCREVCATEVKSILFKEEKLDNVSKLTLKEKVPSTILESILDECDHWTPEYVPMMLELCERNSLEKININNCRFLNDSHFEEIMKIKPTSVEIDDCLFLTDKSFHIISKYGENLEFLKFGSSAEKMISADMNGWMRAMQNDDLEWDVSLGLLNTPKLRQLTWWSGLPSGDTAGVDFLECLTRRFVCQLERLDYSYTSNVESLDFLLKAKDTLTCLILRDAVRSTNSIRWDILAEFSNLTFLDVSRCKIDDERTGVLTRIVEKLNKLTHLDVSENRLSVSQLKDGSGEYRINALASREENPLEFVNLYKTSTFRCRLIPARVIVKDDDYFLDDLVSLLRGFSKAKDLPPVVIDRLEIISKQNMTENGCPWKESVNLLIQVAGPNLFHFCSDYQEMFVFPFVCAALRESHRLAPTQVDQLLKCVVKLLTQDWQYGHELEGAIECLPLLSRCMELWSLQNTKILVGALLQAARTAMRKCRAERDREDQSEEVNDCVSSLFYIAEYLLDDMGDSAVARIRTLEMDREIVAVAREVREFESEFHVPKGVSVILGTLEDL